MTLKAIIFGSIGTVTETSDMQHRAFNRAFAEAGLNWDWDFETYKDMVAGDGAVVGGSERISRSEEHTSELQSQEHISYAVFCHHFLEDCAFGSVQAINHFH